MVSISANIRDVLDGWDLIEFTEDQMVGLGMEQVASTLA